jgi:hypothetical protein
MGLKFPGAGKLETTMSNFDPFGERRQRPRTPSNRTYISPGQVSMGLEETTPMSNYIPSGMFAGKSVGRGVVVPRHRPGRGGGSMGFDPHNLPHKKILVDPHVPGCSVALDLDKLTPEAVVEAYGQGVDYANEVMEDPPDEMDGIDTTIEEGPRLAGAAAAHILARNYDAAPDGPVVGYTGQGRATGRPYAPVRNNGVSRPRSAPQPRVAPGSTGEHKRAALGQATVGHVNPAVNVVTGNNHGQAGQPRPAGAPNGRPMAKFRTGTPAPATSPQPASAPKVVDLSKQQVGPPQRRVTFDFGEQVGVFPFRYHAVERTNGAIVLIWDTRWTQEEPYSPEQLPESNRFAVQIDGDPETHLVMSLGNTFTFEHNGFKHFFLGIVESASGD